MITKKNNKNKICFPYWDLLIAEILVEKKVNKSCNIAKTKHKNYFSKKRNFKYKLGGKFKNVCFSQREAECMVYLLQNKNVYEIAKELDLSHRSIESYIANMKDKVCCRFIAELIKIVSKSNFPKHIDLVIKNKNKMVDL